MSLAERDARWAIAGTGWTEARANPNRFTYLRKARQEGPAPGPAREVSQQRTTVEPRTRNTVDTSCQQGGTSRHLLPWPGPRWMMTEPWTEAPGTLQVALQAARWVATELS